MNLDWEHKSNFYDWITVNGTHTPVDEGGNVVGGCKNLQGRKFETARRVKRKSGAESAKRARVSFTPEDNFPSSQFRTPMQRKMSQKLAKSWSDAKGANTKSAVLLSKIKHAAETSIGALKYTKLKLEDDGYAFRVSYSRNDGSLTETALILPKMKNDEYTTVEGETSAHEMAHYLDYLCTGRKTTDSETNGELTMSIQKEKKSELGSFSREAQDIIKKSNEEFTRIKNELTEGLENKIKTITKDYKSGMITYAEYSRQYDKEYRDVNFKLDREFRKQTETTALLDMYDAMTGGELFDKSLVHAGHGGKAFSSVNTRCKELLANYVAVSLYYPEQIEVFKSDFPETAKNLELQVERMTDIISNR